MRFRVIAFVLMVLPGLALAPMPRAAETDAPLLVGNLVDFSGRTSMIGRMYGQGKIDAVAYINAHGGVNGRPITLLTADYGYVLPQAVTAFNRWTEDGPLVAIQGWGASDTAALEALATRDEIPYFSADFSAARTDPIGTERQPGTPYHFIVGPTYADALRALLQWAQENWWAVGPQQTPVYAQIGDGSDFAGATRDLGEAHARELGFDVAAGIRYAAPDDAEAACSALEDDGVHYAYLATTRDLNIPLVEQCRAMGVKTRFLTNIWGFDERFMERAGTAADGMVWVMANAPWGTDAPGQALLSAISGMSSEAQVRRSVHYIQGVCTVYFMKDAMERAAGMDGGITGPNVKAAMYRKHRWSPQGLEGICNPAIWTPEDHRGVTDVRVYMSHVTEDARRMEHVYTAMVPRRPERPNR